MLNSSQVSTRCRSVVAMAMTLVVAWNSYSFGQTQPATEASDLSQLSPDALLQKFRKEYPPAADKLANAYSHVRITGVKTTRHQEPGGQDLRGYSGNFVMERSGENILVSSTFTKSSMDMLPAGSISISVGNADGGFRCFKRPDETDFSFRPTRRSPQFSEPVTAMAPYSFMNDDIRELVSDTSHDLQAACVQRDGQKVFDIFYFASRPRGDIKKHMFFSPGTYALLGGTFEFATVLVKADNVYSPQLRNGIPILMSASTQEKNNGAVTDENQDDLLKVEFVEIPAKNFEANSLERFGVKNIQPASNLWGGGPPGGGGGGGGGGPRPGDGDRSRFDRRPTTDAAPLPPAAVPDTAFSISDKTVTIWTYVAVIAVFGVAVFILYRQRQRKAK